MGKTFWIRRYLIVFAGATLIIAASHLIRGRSLEYAASEGLLWAFVTASIFTAARIYQSGRGQRCAVCKDTPDFHDQSGPRA